MLNRFGPIIQPASVRVHAGALLVAAALYCQPSSADDPRRPVGLAASLGFSHPGQPGFGLTGGLWARWGYLLAFASIDLTIVEGPPNERYQTDTFSNGESACRDLSNGQFAKEEECGSSVTLIGAMLEAHLMPLPGLFLGGGLRTSPAPGPYGALGYAGRVDPAVWFWFVRGAAGAGFLQAHIGFGL